MAKYQKSSTVGGKWVDKKELIAKNITKAKIVSETTPQPSQYDKDQDVCKVQFQGLDEPVNVALNGVTINALIDAYGEGSKEWQGHVLKVEVEKVRVGGKAVLALYLIPDGYHRFDDANGYSVIAKEGDDEVVIQEADDEESMDVPF